MYRSKEKADKISKLIELSKEKHRDRYPEIKAIQADNDWATSHLLAKLFFESQVLPKTYISPEELIEFHKEFESKEGAIDLQSLIDKLWIRTIGGIIEIPNGIKSVANQYEKIKDAEAEFNFLIEAVEKFKSNTAFEKLDFLEFLNDYQSRKEKTISLDKCKALHFIEDKEEKIKIHDLEYYKPVFHHKKELQFVEFFLQKESRGDKYKLAIQSDTLASLHAKHKSIFPATPTLDDFVIQKLIIKDGDSYFLNLWACEPNYWGALGNKIGALLWSLMKNSGKYSVVNHMVRAWIMKMRFINTLNTSPKVMKSEDIEVLLNSCLEILLNENDIIGNDIEISKLALSGRRWENMLLSNASKPGFPHLTKAKNIFELFNLMEDCNEVNQSDLLWHQESRWFIDNLIQLIVFYDNKKGDDGIEYPIIRKLLSAGINRPYLLWETSFFIYYWRPEIIPYLCLDKKVASLAFNLSFISETDKALSEVQSTEIKSEILCGNFNLLLSVLRNSQELSNSNKALKIFECLVIIAENKWQQYRNNPTKQVLEKRENLQNLFRELINVLKSKKLQGSHYGADGETYKYFFPEVLIGLFIHIKEYNSQKVYTEGVVGLPLVKMELLSMLLKLTSSDKYHKQKDEVEELKEITLANQYLFEYSNILNLESTNRWDYTEGGMKDMPPLWSTNQKGLELIPWEEWALYFEKYNILPQFLTPTRLKLKSIEDKWDKYNQFTVDKIRKHLEILILIHQRLRQNEFVYKQRGFKVDTAISRLELSIVDFVSKYSEQDLDNGRIDILEDRYERTVFGSEENALIPIIAQAVNKFEPHNKHEILRSLTRTDSFTKCLKLLEFLSSETDIEFIKKQIKNFNVSHYLDEKNYIPEIEIVVIKLSGLAEFVDKAKEALEFWKKRILTQRDNAGYFITYFRIKLLIAYYESDEQTILTEKAPVSSVSTSRGFEFNPSATRDFYLGLVKLKKNDPENAYKIFNRLIDSSKNDKSAIAINRFYSHINLAETKITNEEKEKYLSDALIEWDAYENSIPINDRIQALEYVQENIWLNKLNVYDKLQRNNDFDILFNALDKPYQLRKDFFEIRVNNYINRGNYELARTYVNEAKVYHQSKDDLLPEFIKIATEKLENEEDYKRLRKEYQDLISRSPEKLVLILPENIVGKRNVYDYILKEICNSANDILDIVNSVEKIDNEDKYTDLLILSLQSKFRQWYWKIGNARGGFSASNKRNLGELDFVINSADNERIATCEALLINGKNTSTVTTHVIKTFNYDHRRTLFFILVYYSGNNLNDHWKDYETNIIPNIQYPVGFPLSATVEEIKEPFTNNSIRVLLAKHGDDTKVYHVFINISYKLPSS
jgi:hypothetical protein